MQKKTVIQKEDIISMEEYGVTRLKERKLLTALKRSRRISVGPDAVFIFECYETMFHQIHEMLWIEKGGQSQVEDELSAYNPLIPSGKELVATMMFEIDDPKRRKSVLSKLGGIENNAFISLGQEDIVWGVSEDDLDRTNSSGKASSVQFLHFLFSEEQIKSFKFSSGSVFLGLDHSQYKHNAEIPKEMRKVLSLDFE